MNFEMIEAILMAANGFTGSIDGECVHLKGAKNSTSHFYEELAKVGLKPEDTPDSLDEALVAVEDEYERQGFINGFRMGAKMMIECIGPAPLDAWNPDDMGNPVSRVR